MSLLDVLEAHHTDILALLDEAEKALGTCDPARGKVLALIRWELMRRLRAYQLFKHHELFDPFRRGRDIERAKFAEAMKVRCLATGEIYEKHVTKWSASGAEGHWPDYEREARAMIQVLRHHLDREGQEAANLLSSREGMRHASCARK